MIEISVVIPVYKAKDCMNELYTRLIATLSSLTNQYEIVFVEDCGHDGSWEFIKELAIKDNKVIAIQLSRNFGQHYAITAGLDHCSGKWVVVMDCDLQDVPEEIPNLYIKAQEGFDIVIAKRKNRKDNLRKRYFSKFFYACFSYLSGIKYDAEVGNFRIMSHKVVVGLKQIKEQLRFLGGMLNWMGFKTAYIEVPHGNRFSGKSSYNFKKLAKLALETIIAYSDKPLWLMIKFGFCISTLAFLFGMYIIWKAFYDHAPVLGWSSIMVSMYFIGGIIMTMLGIIAVYLGKTFDEAKKRPLYIIREMIN